MALPAVGKEQNIHWALGAVTWVVSAGKASPRWEDILSDIKASGFEGFEPFTTPTLPVNDHNMDLLAELAPKYGLPMSGIYWGDKWDRPSEHKRQLEECHRFFGYLKRFGANRLLIGPPGPEVEDERAAISHMAKIVNAVGKIGVEQYGFKTGVHPHIGSLIQNPRQIDQLMEETDPKYFNFAPDTMQIWAGGGDPTRMIEQYISRVVYLHYKDSRPYQRGFRTGADYGVALGEGIIDFPAIHRILKKVHYQGWIAIDVARAPVSPLETARISRAYIDRVLNPIYA
jgi:inosose dehydratase